MRSVKNVKCLYVLCDFFEIKLLLVVKFGDMVVVCVEMLEYIDWEIK